MIWLLTALLWSALVGCEPGTCAHDAECEAERCIDGICVVAECYRNDDCAYGQKCTDRGCESGCDVASDCPAGEACVDAVCKPAECQQTSTDCDYGERCAESECEAEAFPHCQPCAYEDWLVSPNGTQECILYNLRPQGSCDWRLGSGCEADYACFPADGAGEVDDGICLQAFWFKPCSTTVDCARPFVCKADIYQDGSDVGVCWSECPLWRSLGVF